MEKLIELLQQIADLANVGIEALQGAESQAPAEGGTPPPEAEGGEGAPPEQ